MPKLILFVLACYAAWFVFTTAELPLWDALRSKIADRSTTFTKFILCPICSGFWCSVGASYAIPLFDAPAWMGNVGYWFVVPCVQGLAGATSVYLIELQVGRLESR
jgi:hypothetical protein